MTAKAIRPGYELDIHISSLPAGVEVRQHSAFMLGELVEVRDVNGNWVRGRVEEVGSGSSNRYIVRMCEGVYAGARWSFGAGSIRPASKEESAVALTAPSMEKKAAAPAYDPYRGSDLKREAMLARKTVENERVLADLKGKSWLSLAKRHEAIKRQEDKKRAALEKALEPVLKTWPSHYGEEP